ncbi:MULTISPECIES: TetR/AcrR family transcriptional regulator [Vibrio]|uniref:TetR/AcrR family transcriptional regulator n=1 Tax=Vibrio casei TaxID=673372 RepID=A0A368LL44_9VIBR|nr:MULTISPECIES: TetR/AcrR family transcriptional regulator [Vibrio]RCS72515.1 TetR/AcrR family transcriptional regulator [Vibrio casei]SJN36259.1 Quorum-sensing regulator of virulence HapR [Vibrio casei]HBV75142.1 TetR/AcrR family transcriptional regulator [Vibrio sp.]
MDMVTKRPRTRLNPEKRKLQLLEIGIEVFARRGIGRGGHADIADIAQVSVATAFNYFPTREDLVDDVLNQVEQNFSAFLQESIDPSLPVKTNLSEISNRLIDIVLKEEQWIKIWFEWSTSTREEVWPLFVATHGQHQKYFRELFLNAIENGELCKDHNPGNIAKLFHGICYSIYVQANRRPDKEYLTQLADSFLDMLCIYKE